MHAILFDVTRCKGCERCVEACVEANGDDPGGRGLRPGDDARTVSRPTGG